LSPEVIGLSGDVIVTRVWEILHGRLGARNAIKGKDLAARVGLQPDKTGERAVQKAVELLRKSGKPIAALCSRPDQHQSDSGRPEVSGYFVPITAEEKRAYLRSMDSRIESMCVARRMAVGAMGIPPTEQGSLFGGPDGRRSA
jgi:hypothetical protein